MEEEPTHGSDSTRGVIYKNVSLSWQNGEKRSHQRNMVPSSRSLSQQSHSKSRRF